MRHVDADAANRSVAADAPLNTAIFAVRPDAKAFDVKLADERAQDEGGPYRQVRIGMADDAFNSGCTILTVAARALYECSTILYGRCSTTCTILYYACTIHTTRALYSTTGARRPR